MRAMAGSQSLNQYVQLNDVALAALAFGSGVMDVASFITLGNVFASAMTGNTALLGISLSEGQLVSAGHSASALVGFILGAALAAVIALRITQRGDADVVRPLLLAEGVCLLAFAATLSAVGGHGESILIYWLIFVAAFAMGIQGVAALNVPARRMNTIVFTSTLINIVISVTRILMRRSPRSRSSFDAARQTGLFLAYGGGTIAAGLLIGPFAGFIGWVPLAAVFVAIICYRRERESVRVPGVDR
jgi:uncharacterized membrane protein YoaK (UPF0700 family)